MKCVTCYTTVVKIQNGDANSANETSACSQVCTEAGNEPDPNMKTRPAVQNLFR